MAEHGYRAVHPAALKGAAKGVKAVPADESLAGPGAVADEIHAARDGCDGRLGKLQLEPGEEGNDLRPVLRRFITADAEQNEVIHVPAVVPDAKLALDEVIQRVQVDQRVKLAQQVSDRYSNRLAVVRKLHHQIHEAAVLDLRFDQPAQNRPVDAVEEFANIELQRVAVARHGLHRSLRVVGGLVGATSDATGEGLVDKCSVEYRPGHGIDGVLRHQVTEGRREDSARLRLINHETEIGARGVGSVV